MWHGILAERITFPCTARFDAPRAAKREHVGASADLDSVVSEISQQVRLLDGLVRYRFGGNAELMGAWASARNVAGPFRSHGAPAA